MSIPAHVLSDPVSTDDQVALWQAWDDFDVALRRARGRAAHLTPDGLTFAQFRMLRAIDQSADGRCGQIAEHIGIAAPTVTRMLTSLEKAGFVARTRSTADRRGVSVRLTVAGQEALGAKQHVVTDKRRALFDSLSPDERRQAQRLFRRLAEEMDVL